MLLLGTSATSCHHTSATVIMGHSPGRVKLTGRRILRGLFGRVRGWRLVGRRLTFTTTDTTLLLRQGQCGGNDTNNGSRRKGSTSQMMEAIHHNAWLQPQPSSLLSLGPVKERGERRYYLKDDHPPYMLIPSTRFVFPDIRHKKS